LSLAAWLLSGKQSSGSWLVAVANFSGFAVVSFYQGWIGQSSCGCFGRLSVSPWYAFGLDSVIVVALVFYRPELKSFWDNPRRKIASAVLPIASILIGTVLIAGLMIGLANLSFGSFPGAIAYFRGDRVTVEPRLIDVGQGEAGEGREVSVTLTNWTGQPIQVFGGTSD
jgi:hypothetical protein